MMSWIQRLINWLFGEDNKEEEKYIQMEEILYFE